LLIERSRGDRGNLINELDKIESYMKSRKSISIDEILKLTDLAENYNVTELLDSCLNKNSKKTINILNENNFTLEDCILIIRSFSIKLKRLQKIHQEYQKNKNLESIISSFKPPIFWKDKDNIKRQITNSRLEGIENMIFKTNDIELLIKKNSNNAVSIMSDFIISTSR
jgi:DNA polymerase-3 subunit delta